MENVEVSVKKEINRICRAFLEISIEGYTCFNEMVNLLLKTGSESSKSFIMSPDTDGLLKWLRGVTEFGKYVRKHIQDGRLSLLNFLNEQIIFNTISSMQKKKYDSKSEMVIQIEEMIQGVFDLSLIKNDSRSRYNLNRSSSILTIVESDNEYSISKYVKNIETDFIKVQKEPIDVAHLKTSQYLLGCFDGSLLLKDIYRPENDVSFEQHLRNRATWVRSIIIDCDHKIWVATSNGLTVYNRLFKIIRQMIPYDDKVKFFGHFRILWTDSRKRYIFWWCDRGSLKIIDARTLKTVLIFKNILKHKDERPNHYTFLDGEWKKMFIITNHQSNIGIYYILDVFKRRMHGGDKILPNDTTNRLFAHVCIAFNSPSNCIVTTGVSTLVGTDHNHLHSKEEISHMTVFRLMDNNTVRLVDYQLNPELKLMTISSVVFHTRHHTRILSVLTKHVYIIDLVNDKLNVLFKIKDINKGECVHQLLRLDDSFLFVGNFGQIFRITFNQIFFGFNDNSMNGREMESLGHESVSINNKSNESTKFTSIQ